VLRNVAHVLERYFDTGFGEDLLHVRDIRRGYMHKAIRNKGLDGVENQAVGNGDDGRRISPVGGPRIEGDSRALETPMNRG
jgi:hypothetical protein